MSDGAELINFMGITLKTWKINAFLLLLVLLSEQFQINPFDFYSLISYFNTILLQLKRKIKK